MNLMELLKETKTELRGIKRGIKLVQEKAELLESRAKVLEQIKEAINGLDRTKTQMEEKRKRSYDPGKYDTAYFYVKEISGEDIQPDSDFAPSLHEPCPKCGGHVPVIMSYNQTYDSPEGDKWQKQALLICCNNLNVLKTLTRDYRFL